MQPLRHRHSKNNHHFGLQRYKIGGTFNLTYDQGNVNFDLVVVLRREVQNLAVHHCITEIRLNRNTKN